MVIWERFIGIVAAVIYSLFGWEMLGVPVYWHPTRQHWKTRFKCPKCGLLCEEKEETIIIPSASYVKPNVICGLDHAPVRMKFFNPILVSCEKDL